MVGYFGAIISSCAGFLASAIGMYSFAAKVGSAPANPTSLVRWITSSQRPAVARHSTWRGAEPYSTAATGGYSSPRKAAPRPIIKTPPTRRRPTPRGRYRLLFLPRRRLHRAVVNEIRQARQQIFVQAYSFTSVPIATALVERTSRGVAVYIVLDKSQRTEKYSGADFVANAGIPTLIDAAHAIAHNKIMLIDGKRSSPAASTSRPMPSNTTPRTCWSSATGPICIRPMRQLSAPLRT